MAKETMETHTARRQFEQLVNEGRKFCYKEVYAESLGWIVGVVVEKDQGYYSTDWGPYQDELSATFLADSLNDMLGVLDKEVMLIVASSMMGRRARRRRVE